MDDTAGDLDERPDLLTFEEGLTGHPLSSVGVYVCVNGVREDPRGAIRG